MPKLGVFSGREICDILADWGYEQLRIHGSHAIMGRRADNGDTCTVPVPLHKSVKIGTLKSIIRQSGVPNDQFIV